MLKSARKRTEGLGRRAGIRRTAKRRAGITASQWRELEGLWKAAVHARAGGVCEMAGKEGHACNGPLQCHHIITRRVKILFADVKNGLLLCKGAHYWWHEVAQGGEQWKWFEYRFGSVRLDYLNAVRNSREKPQYGLLKDALVKAYGQEVL